MSIEHLCVYIYVYIVNRSNMSKMYNVPIVLCLSVLKHCESHKILK